jgi:RND family efflux transporter MFP subunit
MNAGSRLTMRWPAAIGVGVALVVSGVGIAYWSLRPKSPPPAMTGATAAKAASAAAPTSARAEGAPLSDVTIPLSDQAIERAGIKVAPVRAGGAAASLRLPGVVQPNAYRQVIVTPLVSGRVTRVAARLGERVRRGQTLAQVYSPELAEAQTRYISARAELGAHERELERTQELVKIGAASRQDLERIHAEHTAQQTAVQSAQARLELLGVALSALSSGKDVNATTTVPAPIDGIVTEREANAGLNVDPSTKLFTVVDLSTVWIVADVYEKDFARVHVGSPATVTTAAYPRLALHGRVSYIDPQVNPDTRTAKARIEAANPRSELRLGMYADVLVSEAAALPVAVVPRQAVQSVGERSVVYVTNPKEAAKFIEREVQLGALAGEEVEVLSGVRPGDVIVTEGSFFIRAERERLGLRPPAPGASPATSAQAVRVTVSDTGFEPARVSLKTDAPAQITFVRTSEKTCATAVAFPSLNIRRDLPLNQPVTIELTPKSGELEFTCGLNMFRGTIVVE